MPIGLDKAAADNDGSESSDESVDTEPEVLSSEIESLGEIRVTGQKIERSLQDTTDSTTIITSEDLEEGGIIDLRDAFRLAPNINYSPSNNGNNGITIRGINSEGVGVPGGNAQPLVSVIVDGAAQSLEGIRKGARGTWDVESIEILRGPQINYGRNALAGAVVVKTKDPQPYFEFTPRIVLDDQGIERAALLNVPFNEDLSFRATAEYIDKSINIDYSDESANFLDNEDFYNIRAKLLYEPSSNPDFSAKFTYSRTMDDPSIAAINGDPGDRFLGLIFDGIETRINDVDNYTLDLNYALSDRIDITSVSTATRTFTQFGAPSPNAIRDETRKDLDFSQDVRALYTSNNEKFKLLLGGFYGNYNNERDSFVQRRLEQTDIMTITDVVGPNDDCANLNFTANGDGRWVDIFSDAYGQIDQGYGGSAVLDGFFQFSALPAVTILGTGADIFPFEGNWADVGLVLYDNSSLTGVGAETAPANAGIFDFDTYVADNDSILSVGYDTSVALNAGNVTFNNGTPTAVDATYDIFFTYAAGNLGGFPIPATTSTGTLTLNPDNTFDLFADGPSSTIGQLGFIWDFDGTYDFSGTAGCPPAGTTITRTTAVPNGTFAFSTIQDIESTRRRKNYALYSELDWQLLEKVRLIAGLRYDSEDVTYRDFNRGNIGTGEPVNRSESTSYDALLPRAGLVYDITSKFSLGLTATRGYRAGFVGFVNNTVAGFTGDTLNEVDPEYAWNYEFSIRSLWNDGKVRANANIFYTDWEDQQINVSLDGSAFNTFTDNAGESELYGAELDLTYLPIEGLTLRASLGYLNTEFTDYEDVLNTNLAGTEFTLEGNEFTEAPEWSGALSFKYNAESGWFVGGDLNYQSEYYGTGDAANLLEIGSRALVNVNAGYVHDRFRIIAGVNNVFDREYIIGEDITGGRYVGNERVYSISGEIFFGDW
ncbi:MAG: TonB-dependent receptor [Pseudomonadota bacterium]